MRPVCVVGAGTMGRGITQIALVAGHRVVLCDPDQSQVESAAKDIRSRLERKSANSVDETMNRLSTASSIDAVIGVTDPLVVEAVVERLDVKVAVFTAAAERFGAECILATNTSSLSVTEIAAGVPLPERVVGMHFFNPVPVMSLVEIVRGLRSDESVVQETAEIARSWGKAVAYVRSTPGFIVNRVARAYYGEALRLVEEGSATPECIDELMRSGNGFRMGPFELMDLIGVEVNNTVTRTVWTAFNFEPRFAPSVLQAEMSAGGLHGRKTGRGFYDYADGASPTLPHPISAPALVPSDAALRGRDEHIEAIWGRAGGGPLPQVDGEGVLVVGDLGVIKQTVGRTARDEANRLGSHVVLLDRCLDPHKSSAVALSGTSDALTAAAAGLLSAAGIAAYHIEDTPGLVAARTLSLIANEAWETAQQGTATPGDIDTAMVLGTNYPCGPFEWTRRWGPTVVRDLLDNTYEQYRDPRYRTSRGLRVAAG